MQCKCFDGYTGADCSEFTCPFGAAWTDFATGTDIAHQDAECSNMGVCDRTTGTCSCRVGFEGNACERKSCPGFCSNKGKCQSMYYHAQTKDPGAGTVFSYETIWDAHKIYGCKCDDEYSGNSCSMRVCPVGDDPLTGNGADVPSNPAQKNDQQAVTCKAGGGSFTLTFRGKTTTVLQYNSDQSTIQSALEALPTLGVGHVTVLMTGAQACSESGSLSTSFTVEFLQEFGNLPLLVPNQENLYNLNAVSGNVILTVAKQIVGTKEASPCSNRGLCDTGSGYCMCNINYDTSNGYAASGTRGDCGYPTATIQACPGSIACSGHGECANSPTYKCSCSVGWTGSDCSERLCPADVPWFGFPTDDNKAHLEPTAVECSNMGTCDRAAGVCACDSGFTGSSCNQLTCPGLTELCSGHGQCLDMNTLAKLTKKNGEYAGFTYGNTPNNPVTWDALKVFGCLCDDMYTGYDCSHRTCATGDDPQTTEQLDERQIIACTDADVIGTISFKFREQQTVQPVAAAATKAEVKAALEGLSSIGTVEVDTLAVLDADSLCTAAGNQFAITFKTEHGNLPMIQVIDASIDTIAVTEEVSGTKEQMECAGRGTCNVLTGQCNCFPGYGSSDGMGGAGQTGDCGYIEPVATLLDQ